MFGWGIGSKKRLKYRKKIYIIEDCIFWSKMLVLSAIDQSSYIFYDNSLKGGLKDFNFL